MSIKPKWIKSGGGPLICVENELAPQWLGVNANSTTQGSDRTYANDYKRACSVSDYVGKIALGNRHALILGDMPLETQIWQLHAQLPRIVRVYYADPEVNVVNKLESMHDLDFSSPVETLEIDVISMPMIVFDSAYPGQDVGGAHLSFELPPSYIGALALL
nr:Imm21 family immunity protein [Nostoc sp. DedQUE07]MDZ8127711.1 Imm21 family immunity protein [Nostoc sp. DedQUE07]